MGESTSDFFVFSISPYVAVAFGFLGLLLALYLQLTSRRYIALVYWFAVVMVAVFGTMAADVLHVVLHIPYAVSTALFAAVLALVFLLWYRSERTLSIHTIYPGRRELFYWATVMATFALGTAAGDFTASTLGLGYFASIILFAVLFLLPALGLKFNLRPIAAFWFAYVMTRPLGASVADWLGKSRLGGLGFGDGVIALILLVLIVVVVLFLAVSKVDQKPPGSASPDGRARSASDTRRI